MFCDSKLFIQNSFCSTFTMTKQSGFIYLPEFSQMVCFLKRRWKIKRKLFLFSFFLKPSALSQLISEEVGLVSSPVSRQVSAPWLLPLLRVDAQLCATTTQSSLSRGSDAPFSGRSLSLSLTCHHEHHGLRERVLFHLTAPHLGHHLRPPVGRADREWRRPVGRGGQVAARAAADPDETGREVHSAAPERVHLTVRHVR